MTTRLDRRLAARRAGRGGLGALGLTHLIDRSPSRQRDLCLATICQRILRPGSKLATARSLAQPTLAFGLAEISSEAFPGERLAVCRNPRRR